MWISYSGGQQVTVMVNCGSEGAHSYPPCCIQLQLISPQLNCICSALNLTTPLKMISHFSLSVRIKEEARLVIASFKKHDIHPPVLLHTSTGERLQPGFLP